MFYNIKKGDIGILQMALDDLYILYDARHKGWSHSDTWNNFKFNKWDEKRIIEYFKNINFKCVFSGHNMYLGGEDCDKPKNKYNYCEEAFKTE